jgi:hypothetical protein
VDNTESQRMEEDGGQVGTRLDWSREGKNLQDLRFSRRWLWRLLSFGMLRHVVLVRNDVLWDRITSIIRTTRIGELGTTLAVTSNRSTLCISSLCASVVS